MITVTQVAGGLLGGNLSHAADCNVYLVQIGQSALLIDAGSGLDSSLLESNIIRTGVQPTLIEAVLLTHAHFDHSGGAAWFAGLGVPIIAPAVSAEAIETADEDFIGLPRARRLGLYPDHVRWKGSPVAMQVRDESCWRISDVRLSVLQTPGHSCDGVTYILETQDSVLAFTGDTVFANGRVLISTEADCSPSLLEGSLRKLAGLSLGSLYPGHGASVPQDAADHVKATLPFLDQTLLPPNLL